MVEMGLLIIFTYTDQALSNWTVDLGSVFALGECYEICVSVIPDQYFHPDRLDKCFVY